MVLPTREIVRLTAPAALAVVCLLPLCLRASAQAPERSADETAIRGNVQAYVEAFNRKDSKAVAALWAPEGVYASRTTGRESVGAAAIEQELAAEFAADKATRLEVTVNAIDWLSPNVAIERGTARLVAPEADPAELDYSAVHVKHDGKWLLDRITEDEVAAAPSHHEQLKPLEWLIGDWSDEDAEDGLRVEMSCKWAKNQNFISRAFSVSLGGEIELSGLQIIGWDAAQGKIRSWAFDSDGGFAEGTWSNKENRWIVDSAATLPDGRRASSVNVMTVVDDNSVLWKITGREVDGEILPDLPEVKVSRVHQP